MNKLIKFFFNRWYRFFPPRMVNYWMHGDVARAKVIHAKDGSYRMMIEGEKYPYPGFPRGHILFGSVARLKHKTKNLLFNDIWARLEAGEDRKEIIKSIKGPIMRELIADIEKCVPDMIPHEKMVPTCQEIWRAMTEVERKFQGTRYLTRIKQGLTFFLQEDDAYRFRIQWACGFLRYYSWFRPLDIRSELRRVIKLTEYAEMVPDMKARMVLIARVLLLILEDDELNNFINAVLKEINLKKLKLSKADKYYFRGKYFKVDHQHYDY